MSKSGGVATNIGIHFFDMLTWIFGEVQQNIVHERTNSRSAGFLKLKRANVRWFLSVDYDDLPQTIKEKGQRTYRSIKIGNDDLEFSGGFTDLHTETYKNILNGNGFGLDDAMNSIITAHDIRNAKPVGLVGDYHPLLK
jgi:UDP-N-acetyl-2-amino-2-deoxyglucuronate dehydrogenase